MSPLIYPWHEALLSQLSARRDKLPHAMLLSGKAGTGKFTFAKMLAQTLLCQSPLSNGAACQQCASCGWYVQQNHPDFRLLTAEQEGDEEQEAVASKRTSKKTQISVAQVRELANFFVLTSHQSDGRRIILIYPAETLNLTSANALLKMLEEPPAGCMFILVSHQPNRLLPTIVSRCQKVEMPIPDRQLALSWLQEQGVNDAEKQLDYTGGAPLAVLDQRQDSAEHYVDIYKQGAKLDPFHAARTAMDSGAETVLDSLQKWVYDLISCRLSAQIRYHKQQASALQAMTKSVDLSLLLEFQHTLDEAKKTVHHPLNHELQLETIFLAYTQLFKKQS